MQPSFQCRQGHPQLGITLHLHLCHSLSSCCCPHQLPTNYIMASYLPSSSSSCESELAITSLLFGGIWELRVRFAHFAAFGDFNTAPISLLAWFLASTSLDANGTFFFVVRHLHFLLIVCPSLWCCSRSWACSLTSATDILTHQMLLDIHPSCSVHMSLRLLIVDGLVKAMVAGQLMILTLWPCTILSL